MKPNIAPQETGYKYLKFLSKSSADVEWAKRYFKKKSIDIDGYHRLTQTINQTPFCGLNFIQNETNDKFFKRMEQTRKQNRRRKQHKVKPRRLKNRDQKTVLNAEVLKTTKAKLDSMKKEFDFSQGELLDMAVDVLGQCLSMKEEIERQSGTIPSTHDLMSRAIVSHPDKLLKQYPYY